MRYLMVTKRFLKLTVIFLTVSFSGIYSLSAVSIDLSRISMIESSNNPKAYNKHSGASGMYQITAICLADYNQFHKRKLNMQDMFDRDKCRTIAEWYLNKRIPQMLTHYKHTVSIKNILIAYNYGIKNINNPLPKETRDYIRKYEGLGK